jgi:hypothetical protein
MFYLAFIYISPQDVENDSSISVSKAKNECRHAQGRAPFVLHDEGNIDMAYTL